jgi:hypothetical protein
MDKAKILVNIAENEDKVFEITEKAVKAYRKEKYGWFGYEMGTLLKTLTSQKLETSPKNYWSERKEVAQVLGGFLDATKVGKINFTNLLICIYEADQAAEVGYEAVEIFEQAWKDKQWQEAIGGAIATVAFVQGVEQTIPACEAVNASSMDWSTFDSIKDHKLVIEDLKEAGAAIEKH